MLTLIFDIIIISETWREEWPLLSHNKSATILMSSYQGEDKDTKAAEIQNFIHYLELNQHAVFADAYMQ